MYILNITNSTKKITINELKYLIFENYFKRIQFSKENNYYSMKRLGKKRFVVA